MRAVNKRDSIYIQLLKLLVGSAAAALLIFLGLNYAGDFAIDQYCYHPDYIKKNDERYVEKLQKYIDENQLAARDTKALYSWVKKQKMISIRIYRDGLQVFDTEYPEQELWDEAIAMREYEWENYYSVTFSDGKAGVSISGMYAYQFYNSALTAELAVCFLLFLVFVILGIRTKMRDILTLSREIEILEGGSLDYKITVKGKYELGVLAEGLENMRISFQSMIEREAEIVQENQKVVTEMSHDLRTPVTSILLYTEILKKGKYSGEEQMKEYVERIDRQACRMKQLTDHLFEYSLVAGETEMELEDPESFEILFYDLLSETCSYLQQRGFQTECEVEWTGCSTRVHMDYVIRVMDNITSNIIKYADIHKPVAIQMTSVENMAGFSFENGVNQTGKKVESTCVGIQNVKHMMAKMGGVCRVRQDCQQFAIEILFPLWESN